MNETVDVTQPVLVSVTALPGAIFWRQNTGTFRTLDGRRIVSATSITGCADIMGAYRGRPVAIETKVATGLRKTQKIFRQNWERAGGIYIIARSPEEALARLEEIQ